MPSLQKLIEGQPPETIPLSTGVLTIGRGTGSQLQLMSQMVSKTHARLTCSGVNCVLEDVSTNGTLLNGRPMTPQRQQSLRHGDTIGIGSAVLIFLNTDTPEDLSGASAFRPKLAVLGAEDSATDQSMKRKAVRAGDPVEHDSDDNIPELEASKIVSCLSLTELPLRQLTASDPVRRLSQALRCAELLAPESNSAQIQKVLKLMLELYPSAVEIAVIRIENPKEPWLVLATISRADTSRVLLCHPLIRRVAATCEAVLVTDQWRETEAETPKLSELKRCSAVCVPLRGAGGQCLGMIQLTATSTMPPFTVEDLERLTVLAQVLTISICRVSDVILRDVRTAVTSLAAGSSR